MKLKLNAEIETDVVLTKVFKAFKQFMVENLQNYSFSISDDTSTLKDESSKHKEEKIISNIKPKEEIKETNQEILV